MRLIDADALGICKANRNVFDKPEYAHGWNSAVAIVEDAPTVDAAPVVHGEWIADDKFDNGKSSIFHCSVCYYSRSTSVLYTAEQLSSDDPYCRKCGARMDGERKVSE